MNNNREKYNVYSCSYSHVYIEIEMHETEASMMPFVCEFIYICVIIFAIYTYLSLWLNEKR